MNAQAIQPGALKVSFRGHAAPALQPGRHFSDALAARDGNSAERTAETKEQAGRKAAAQLVAQSLVLPILTEARKDPFKTELFHGGQAEDMFGSQLDTILADRITSKSNFPLVDAIYRRISRTGAAEAAGSVNTRG